MLGKLGQALFLSVATGERIAATADGDVDLPHL